MSRIVVRGVGWTAGGEYGCIRRRERSRLDGGEIDSGSRKGLFSHPFKNFGRLDRLSRMTVAGIALALRDGSVDYSPDRKQDIGIVGTSSAGSLATDLLFFRDYLDCGRKLARGSLFIYTLPSSPLGEAAIHFGLLGPLFYVASGSSSPQAALDAAGDLVLRAEAGMMLAGVAEEDAAWYCLLGMDGADPGQGICDVPAALRAAEQGSFAAVIAAFRELNEKKERS